MSSLADRRELVGFFSYSREDDEGSNGALTKLRERIWRELRAQLGRTRGDFRLWQDIAAIPEGRLWEEEIELAIAESVFFIPIITPTTIRSQHCKREFELFLKREAELGRRDLIFPLLYIRVPALENENQWRGDPVLRVIGSRQYIDWASLRHLDIGSTEVGVAIDRFCGNILKALHRQWTAPNETSAPASVQREEAGGPADGRGAGNANETIVRGDGERSDERRHTGVPHRQNVATAPPDESASLAPRPNGKIAVDGGPRPSRPNRLAIGLGATLAVLAAAAFWLAPELGRWRPWATQPSADAPASPRGATSTTTPNEIREAWEQIKDTTNVALLEAFIRRFGDSWYADLARDRIEQLKKSAAQQSVPTVSDTSCRKEGGLKSIEGAKPTKVTFRNSHHTSVRLYWLDYGGERKLYATIGDGDSYTQPTFVTHPWVVADMADTCIALYLPQDSPTEFIIR